jgi:hypothetical protein
MAKIIATKHTSHNVIGPEAPLNSKPKSWKDRSPPDVAPSSTTIQADEIADNGTAIVAAKCF